MFNKILVSVLFSSLVLLGFVQPAKAAAQTNCFDYTYSPRYTAEWGLPIGGADIGDSGVALNHSEYLSLYVQEGCTVTTLLEAEIYYVSKGSKGLEIIGAKGYSPAVVTQAIAQHAHESAVQRMADKANAKRSDGIGMFISVILTALLSSIRGHKDENESFFGNERAVVSITVVICIIMALIAIIVGASIVPTKEECWPVCQSNSALGTVISLVLVAIWNFVCKHGKVVSECQEGATFELFGAQANLDDRMNDLLIFHRWICIDDEAERTSAIREAWAAIKVNITSTVKHAHNDVYACAYPTLDELETTDIAMLIDAGVHVHCSVHGEQLVDPDYYQCTLCCAEEDWQNACAYERAGEEWQSKRGL